MFYFCPPVFFDRHSILKPKCAKFVFFFAIVPLQHAMAQTQLFLALGGGWKEESNRDEMREWTRRSAGKCTSDCCNVFGDGGKMTYIILYLKRVYQWSNCGRRKRKRQGS